MTKQLKPWTEREAALELALAAHQSRYGRPVPTSAKESLARRSRIEALMAGKRAALRLVAEIAFSPELGEGPASRIYTDAILIWNSLPPSMRDKLRAELASDGQ